MIKLAWGLTALFAIAATSLAGTETYSGLASKEYKQVETPSCFSDKELQLDLFGAFERGNGPTHAGPIRNHAWGGGVAVNYFFTRYFGLSAEGEAIDGRPNGSHGLRPKRAFESANGSVIFRYPIDAWCLAPYLFMGGGMVTDDSTWGLFHIGVGLEYRIVPNKVGLFADARWNYYGDRYGHDVQNNFLFRGGVRLIF
jgi:hypothetical protein